MRARARRGTADEGETLFPLGRASPSSRSYTRLPALGAYHPRKTVPPPPRCLRPHTSYDRPPFICLLCVYSRVAPSLSVVLLLQFRCSASGRYLSESARYDSSKLKKSRETQDASLSFRFLILYNLIIEIKKKKKEKKKNRI